MRLERITVSGPDGLKGQRFTEDLTGADVFVGPNGSGKSTRLLAVMAGARGLASTPTDARREYIGPDRPRCGVALDFDVDGDRRVLQRDLSAAKGKAADVADADAKALIGEHLVRWDLGDFASMTDSGRTALLERVCALGEGAWTWPRVDAHLRDTLELPASGATGHVYDEVATLKADGVDGWVEAATKHARTIYTAANAAQKQAAAAADAMAEERRGAPVASLDLAGARERAKALGLEVSELERAVDGARDDGAAERFATERRRRVIAVDETTEAVTRCEVELREAQNEAAGAEATLVDALKAAGVESVSDEALAEAAEAALRATAKLAEAESSREEAKRAHIEAVAVADSYQRGAGVEEHCVHCGGLDPLGRGGEREAARERAHVTDRVYEDALADEALARRRADRARKHEQMLQSARAAAEAAARTDRASDAASARLDRAKREHKRAVEALTAHEAAPAPVAGAPDENTVARLAAARETLAQARADVETVVRQQEREAAFQRAIVERERTKARFGEVKKLGKALKALRETLTAEGFRPIEDAANVLLERAGSDLRASFQDAARYGAARGDLFVHFAALSDAERALVGAAIGYAFARVSGAPWRAVLLDRMEVLDEERLPGVVEAFRGLVADGELDNFIGAFTTTTSSITALQPIQRWLGPLAGEEEEA